MIKNHAELADCRMAVHMSCIIPISIICPQLGAEGGAVNHNGAVGLIVGTRVGQIEPLGEPPRICRVL